MNALVGILLTATIAALGEDYTYRNIPGCYDLRNDMHEYQVKYDESYKVIKRLVNELLELQNQIPAMQQKYERWKVDFRKEYEGNWERYDRALSKVVLLDAQWPDMERDLRLGLYCSRCERSKSEIERAEHITFAKHLDNVKGLGKSTPAALYKKKYEEYLTKRTQATQEASTARDELERCEKNANSKLQDLNEKLASAQERLANIKHDGREVGSEVIKTDTILTYVKATWKDNCLQKNLKIKPISAPSSFKELYDHFMGKSQPIEYYEE